LLDDSRATVEELDMAVILTSYARMFYAIIWDKVLSIKSYDILLVGSNACWANAHYYCKGDEGEGARHSHGVYQADERVSEGLIGSRPKSRIPCMIVQNYLNLVGG